MIERELYLKKIEPWINKDIVKVLTGIRRCGKSTILNQIIAKLSNENIKKENIILINLESATYNKITNFQQLDKIVREKIKNLEGKAYLFFDEIQNVKDWEKSINSYLVDFNADIYITGSNSNLLSGELASRLTGRYIEIKIFPFSYKEALICKKDLKFEEYIKYGGMPFIFQISEENEKIKYLNDLYSSILFEDIIKRYEIREINLISRLTDFLMDNTGKTFSADSISKYLKHEGMQISRNTIYNYLNYLEYACLTHKVSREDLQDKRILKFREKYYFTDQGFIETLFGKNIDNISHILENVVYMELLRRDYKVYVGKLNGYEVDFVCKKGKEKLYIQVCYLLSSSKTIEREFRPLQKIKDNYEKLVLSMDNFDFSKEGIKHQNIVDFLLS